MAEEKRTGSRKRDMVYFHHLNHEEITAKGRTVHEEKIAHSKDSLIIKHFHAAGNKTVKQVIVKLPGNNYKYTVTKDKDAKTEELDLKGLVAAIGKDKDMAFAVKYLNKPAAAIGGACGKKHSSRRRRSSKRASARRRKSSGSKRRRPRKSQSGGKRRRKSSGSKRRRKSSSSRRRRY